MRHPERKSEYKDMLQAVMPIKDKLYRYAFNILGNRMAAEDVVQEVFVKVWSKKEHLATVDNKEAWCMTVTRNLALDKRRKNGHRHEAVEDHYSLADKGMTPFEVTKSSDTMSMIMEAIQELPEDQQQVVHLRDVEGYSYNEIAEITGLTLDKVKVYLHRARITLRNKLVSLYK